MANKIIHYFDKMYNNNKISHAFLIGNSTFDNLKDDLNIVLKDYFFHYEINIEDNPDIFILTHNNNVIKKEKLLELQNFLNNTSQICGKKIYIIKDAELLNSSAANSLLKILEEPKDNIFAFLITNNINLIMETIKSRCQILFVSSESSNKYDFNEEIVNKTFDILSLIVNKQNNSFPFIHNLLGKNVEREDLNNILMILSDIYREILYIKCGLTSKSYIKYLEKYNKYLIELSNSLDQNKISEKIIFINNLITDSKYNLNISLLIDKLIIELGR